MPFHYEARRLTEMRFGLNRNRPPSLSEGHKSGMGRFTTLYCAALSDDLCPVYEYAKYRRLASKRTAPPGGAPQGPGMDIGAPHPCDHDYSTGSDADLR